MLVVHLYSYRCGAGCSCGPVIGGNWYERGKSASIWNGFHDYMLPSQRVHIALYTLASTVASPTSSSHWLICTSFHDRMLPSRSPSFSSEAGTSCEYLHWFPRVHPPSQMRKRPLILQVACSIRVPACSSRKIVTSSLVLWSGRSGRSGRIVRVLAPASAVDCDKVDCPLERSGRIVRVLALASAVACSCREIVTRYLIL
jgi:hypothetical protein